MNLGAPGPKPGSQICGQAGDCDVVFSYPMFLDLQKANSGFSGHRRRTSLFGANVAYQGVTVNGDGMLVSGSYFPVLGLTPRARTAVRPARTTRRSARTSSPC